MSAKLGLCFLMSLFLLIGIVALGIMSGMSCSKEEIMVIGIVAGLLAGSGAVQLGDVLDRIANK